MNPMHPVKAYTHALSGASVTDAIDPNVGAQRVLYNAGPALAFYAIGLSSGLSASATDHALPAGAIYTISVSPGEAYMAFYSAGSATVYITAGEGE